MQNLGHKMSVDVGTLQNPNTQVPPTNPQLPTCRNSFHNIQTQTQYLWTAPANPTALVANFGALCGSMVVNPIMFAANVRSSLNTSAPPQISCTLNVNAAADLPPPTPSQFFENNIPLLGGIGAGVAAVVLVSGFFALRKKRSAADRVDRVVDVVEKAGGSVKQKMASIRQSLYPTGRMANMGGMMMRNNQQQVGFMQMQEPSSGNNFNSGGMMNNYNSTGMNNSANNNNNMMNQMNQQQYIQQQQARQVQQPQQQQYARQYEQNQQQRQYQQAQQIPQQQKQYQQAPQQQPPAQYQQYSQQQQFSSQYGGTYQNMLAQQFKPPQQQQMNQFGYSAQNPRFNQ